MEDSLQKIVKKHYHTDIKAIPTDGTFKFLCHACGQCCHNREDSGTVMVSPYDMYNILKNKNISCDNTKAVMTFIQKHFIFYIGSSSGIPICGLATDERYPKQGRCVFLEDSPTGHKCSIHAFKPSICRIYPLGRAIEVSDDEFNVQYFLQEDTCNTGYAEKDKHTHTLDAWIPNRIESEKAFITFTQFTKELLDIANLKVLHEIPDILVKGQSIQELFVNAYIDIMYTQYDYTQDFFEQFIQNKNKVLDILTLLIDILKEDFPEILPKK